MHLTFVEADRAGKRWRLREAGLFPLRPEAVGGSRRFVSRPLTLTLTLTLALTQTPTLTR